MIKTELRKLALHKGSLLTSLCFFSLIIFCFSLALGPEKEILRQGGPVTLWILLLLTTLFSTPLFIKREAQEGLLDEIFLHPLSPAFYLLSKVASEFLFLGIPLIGLCMLLSPLFFLSFPEMGRLCLTLLIGFPPLSALGLLGGFLTLHARGSGMLMVFLIFPLTLPLLIFSLSTLELGRLGLDSFPSFCLLISIALFLMIISVAAGNWAFRLAVEG